MLQQILYFLNKPLLRVGIGVGALAGLACFGYFLALYALDVLPLGNSKTPDFGFHLLFMGVACWYYRNRIQQGWMHLWEGLTLCYIVNTVASFLNGWLIYGFVTLIDPSVFSDYIAQMNDLLVSGKDELIKNIGEADYGKMLQDVQATQPAQLITDEMSKKTLMAVLPIILISLIFRKQPPILREHQP